VTVTSNTNPLLQLRDAGQSVWLDFLRRTMVQGRWNSSGTTTAWAG
jgi:hypothetical protein